ncbi:hypothetical protein H0H87_002450 [Tephrocybe sp. NHM501043]|nr:hypothetical protein H0H87_002450 [Tephrocybe sp. NHM501043]
MSTESNIIVPDGFTLHTENTSRILLESNQAFLNPVQEFNRDTSVACIRVWSEELNRAKEEKWRKLQEKKANKQKDGAAKKRKGALSCFIRGILWKLMKRSVVETDDAQKAKEPSTGEGIDNTTAEISPHSVKPPEVCILLNNPVLPAIHEVKQPYKFVLLEALSATGLRSIRYAKEIPLLKHVIANDLSPSATAAMKRNIDLNDLGPAADAPSEGKVRINEGDACTLMYSHREEKNRVDVVDLDPYGTAAPFIDAAVHFSNYGGVPAKAEYCHEAALRLVLHTLSTSATRYGRYIEPLASLSIDFYVRIFVRVKTSPLEVKKALTKTSAYYICSTCQSSYEQPLGRVVEKPSAAGNVNYLFKIQNGPGVTEKCPECDSTLHMAGPMWSGPLHDTGFVTKVLEHLEANQDKYGTAVRMRGMLTVAQEELHVPFYFTPAKLASFFHCTTPALEDVASALLHAGHKISRSHACPGSLKTTATREVVHSIFRSWIKRNPVKMENVSENSPTRRLLAKEPGFEANFKRHPDSVTPSGKMKLVRYQENPTSHWGPGTKAVGGSKRKRAKDDI